MGLRVWALWLGQNNQAYYELWGPYADPNSSTGPAQNLGHDINIQDYLIILDFISFNLDLITIYIQFDYLDD